MNDRGERMCDVKKYEKIYEDIKILQPEDTLQLVLEAETEEQRSFYEMVGDFLLQKKGGQIDAVSIIAKSARYAKSKYR